ncbi:MAG: NEW3 domain-containing protein [Candidatus Aenigmarchaeota archaeon]|nr:NEW3 domain-containing protein [Candidatus Aenigmarchaeota archaeon]
MRKFHFLIFLFFTFLVVFTFNITNAGPNDVWVSCCSSGCNYTFNQSLSFGGRTYYCCPNGWQTSPCCYRSNPSVFISPSSQTGSPGQTLTYSVSIKNNDVACGVSYFNLTFQSCPSGFTCKFISCSQIEGEEYCFDYDSISIPLGSGETKFIDINVASSSSSSAGTYTFTVKATNENAPSYYSTASANYQVPCTPQNVPYCNIAGATYFADKQNSDCSYSDRGDNICRSAGSLGPNDGCTADVNCNGKTANSAWLDGNVCNVCNSTCGYISTYCPPYKPSSHIPAFEETCYYGRSCNANWPYCRYSSTGTLRQNYCDVCSSNGVIQGQYCPSPGTVSGSTCYYGTQSCNGTTCNLKTCILSSGQICHPTGGCILCSTEGEFCSSDSDCCSYYVSGSTCYYNPICSPGRRGEEFYVCSFLTCSLADSCSANTLIVGKTCSPSGCSAGTTYTCSASSHTNCQQVACGGSIYYCTYDGSSWAWRTSKPAEVCDDGIDNDCDGLTDDAPYCCFHSNPSVSISPSSQTGSPGQTLTYTITVINNDNSACNSSTFTLSVTSCPSGFTCNLAQTSLTISPGYSNSTTISVTSSSTSSAGNYTFTVKATNQNAPVYSSTVLANYKVSVTPAPCNQTTPEVYILTPFIVSGGNLTVSVYFECREWYYPRNLTLSLKIDDQEWKECFLNNIGLMTELGWSTDCDMTGRMSESGNCGSDSQWSCSQGTCHRMYNSWPIWVKSNFNSRSLNVTFTCKLPYLSGGSHNLTVTAKVYGSEIALKPSVVTFRVGEVDGRKIIELLLLPFKILRRIFPF